MSNDIESNVLVYCGIEGSKASYLIVASRKSNSPFATSIISKENAKEMLKFYQSALDESESKGVIKDEI